MGKQFSDVSSKYGAPMGRREAWRHERESATGPARLFRVRLDSGGYDDGGAYWGTGQPLYCLQFDTAGGDVAEMFVRAWSRADAWADLRPRVPSVRLVRGA